ncbi:MAG: response regulator [bacterium]
MGGEKNKILIVDDDGFLLDMYAFKFSQNEFEVYTAMSGVLAIKKIKEGLKPDIILMDIIMPDMDGFEMLENINTEKLSPNSIKIILSNKGQQEDIDRGTALGAAGYIVKVNSTPVEVVDSVMKILREKATFKENTDEKSE